MIVWIADVGTNVHSSVRSFSTGQWTFVVSLSAGYRPLGHVVPHTVIVCTFEPGTAVHVSDSFPCAGHALSFVELADAKQPAGHAVPHVWPHTTSGSITSAASALSVARSEHPMATRPLITRTKLFHIMSLRYQNCIAIPIAKPLPARWIVGRTVGLALYASASRGARTMS